MTADDSNSQSPSLVEAISDAMEARIMDLHVSIPARVTAYDAATNKCSAQPVNMRSYIDEDGNRQTEPAAVIEDVPVLFACSATDGLTSPVNVGDKVQLLFSEQSIAMFLRRDGIVDPADDRKHAQSDAVALLGMHSFANPIPGVSATDVILRAKNNLLLGATDAADGVAGLAALKEFMTILSTTTDGAGACAALYAALTAVHWPDNFVSNKVKIPKMSGGV